MKRPSPYNPLLVHFWRKKGNPRLLMANFPSIAQILTKEAMRKSSSGEWGSSVDTAPAPGTLTAAPNSRRHDVLLCSTQLSCCTGPVYDDLPISIVDRGHLHDLTGKVLQCLLLMPQFEFAYCGKYCEGPKFGPKLGHVWQTL